MKMSMHPAAADVAGGEHLAAQEVDLAVARAAIGMPLWFGAKDAPM